MAEPLWEVRDWYRLNFGERFPELQVINIGTLDKPEEIEVSMHYYSDEALPI